MNLDGFRLIDGFWLLDEIGWDGGHPGTVLEDALSEFAQTLTTGAPGPDQVQPFEVGARETIVPRIVLSDGEGDGPQPLPEGAGGYPKFFCGLTGGPGFAHELPLPCHR